MMFSVRFALDSYSRRCSFVFSLATILRYSAWRSVHRKSTSIGVCINYILVFIISVFNSDNFLSFLSVFRIFRPHMTAKEDEYGYVCDATFERWVFNIASIECYINLGFRLQKLVKDVEEKKAHSKTLLDQIADEDGLIVRYEYARSLVCACNNES